MNKLIGVMLMLVFCITLPVGDVLCRILNEAGMGVFQIMLMRSSGIVCLLLPYLMYKKSMTIKNQYWHWYALRSLVFFFGIFVWLSILKYINLSDLYAVGFTAPLFATIMAVFFLKERFSKYNLLGLIGGFLGAMIVIRPGLRLMHPAIFLAFFCALNWGGAMVLTNFLSKSQSHIKLTFYLSLSFIPICIVPSIINWCHLSLIQWGIVIGLVFLTLASHLSLLAAFKYASLSFLMPFDFTSLIFSTTLGWLVFHEKIDLLTTMGGGVIFVAAIYSSIMDHKRTNPQSTKG